MRCVQGRSGPAMPACSSARSSRRAISRSPDGSGVAPEASGAHEKNARSGRRCGERSAERRGEPRPERPVQPVSDGLGRPPRTRSREPGAPPHRRAAREGLANGSRFPAHRPSATGSRGRESARLHALAHEFGHPARRWRGSAAPAWKASMMTLGNPSRSPWSPSRQGSAKEVGVAHRRHHGVLRPAAQPLDPVCEAKRRCRARSASLSSPEPIWVNRQWRPAGRRASASSRSS